VFHRSCLRSNGKSTVRCPQCERKFGEAAAEREARRDAEVFHAVQLGRQLTLAVFVSFLAISVTTIALRASIEGVEANVAIGITRFALSCLLLYAVYLGRAWAFFLLVFLTCVAGVIGCVAAVDTGSVVLGALGSTYFVLAAALCSKPVRWFLSEQRRALELT
jgi:hypothetical protein